MPHRVLITGASGLLGRAMLKEFKEAEGWETLGLAFTRARGGLRACDLTDRHQVAAVIQDIKPDFVVHCAAERRADVVEQNTEVTYITNVTASQYVAQEADKAGAVMIYISTDYVFDGENPPYAVDAQTCPLNKYAKSKLEGEAAVFQVNPGNIVLRIPLLYGQVEYLEECAVTVLFKHIQNTTQDCIMSHYEKRYPTRTSDVAKVLRDLLEKRIHDASLTGIFHWSDQQIMTKYDMSIIMATLFDLPTHHIREDTKASPGAHRPFDAHLDTSRIEKLGICHRTPFSEGIKAYLEPFFKPKYD